MVPPSPVEVPLLDGEWRHHPALGQGDLQLWRDDPLFSSGPRGVAAHSLFLAASRAAPGPCSWRRCVFLSFII